jgi:nucleotide-binding universal stress UspA family protein
MMNEMIQVHPRYIDGRLGTPMEIYPKLVCPAAWDRLMVCTDGSAEGQNAVAVTLELARACGSQVYVVQVLVPEIEALDSTLGAVPAAEVQKNIEAIREAADRLEVTLLPVLPESRTPDVAIVSEAEKLRPDLVILGRRGLTALARILMGSVTARVIGHSPVNVLVVPRGVALGFQRLLVPSDGSPYSEAAWKLALALAGRAKSRLLGVTVAPKKGDTTEAQGIIHQMRTAVQRAGVPVKAFQGVVLRGVAPEAGIVQQAIEAEVDLIVMGSHGRTGLQRLLMGSVTERVIGHTPCPVLVVKGFLPRRRQVLK